MPAPAVSPNDLTRQQLDELDALLQRMLSLPLNKPTDSAPPVPPARRPDPPVPEPASARVVRTDPPSPARSPHLVIPPQPEPAVVSTTVPAASVEELRSFTPPAPKPFEFPTPDRLFGPAIPAAVSVHEFAPGPFPLPPTVEDDAEPVALAPVPDPVVRPRAPVSLLPLVGMNWVMERTLGLFGPPLQRLPRPRLRRMGGSRESGT